MPYIQGKFIPSDSYSFEEFLSYAGVSIEDADHLLVTHRRSQNTYLVHTGYLLVVPGDDIQVRWRDDI